MTAEWAAKSGEPLRVHDLKTWPTYFQATLDGRKLFEARKNDRDYEVGDWLLLREWRPDPDSGYTGRSVQRRVTYILRGPAFGVEAGHVIMGLSPR